MNYAIQTDIFFKEAATFPNIENQTPNKEINQITPLCKSPWPARLHVTHLEQLLCWIKPLIPKYTSAEKAPDFSFSLQLFCFRARSGVNTDKYCFVCGHYPSSSTKSLLNLLGLSAAFYSYSFMPLSCLWNCISVSWCLTYKLTLHKDQFYFRSASYIIYVNHQRST